MPNPEMMNERRNTPRSRLLEKELTMRNTKTDVGVKDSKKHLREAPGVIENRVLITIHTTRII
jgi:hypothetical protein